MPNDRERSDDELTTNDTAHTASRAASDAARQDASTIRETTARPSLGHEVAGTAGGAVAGGAAGTIAAGPIGTILGAIAGAFGGWWVGAGSSDEKGTERKARYTEADDRAYRAHFESEPNRLADRGFEDARAGYVIGHLARQNPEFTGQQFDDVEPSLERAWSEELEKKYGDWAGLRGYVRAAFSPTGRAKGLSPAMEEDRIESLQDPMPE
jgi:uncharacterized protein YcfJ